ncbi:MAG: hypothetical protein V8R40_09720 [Dysosmobacter sp.]
MKKTVTMALTLTMVLGLMSGCGANDTPADNAETNATPANAENFSDEMKIPYAVDLSPEDGADSWSGRETMRTPPTLPIRTCTTWSPRTP